MDTNAYIESGKIESFVLGLADKNERAEINYLSSIYPEIKQAIEELSIELENYLQTASVPPPASVKEKLFSQILIPNNSSIKYAENISPGIVKKIETPTNQLNYTKWLAAASFFLLILSAFANYILYNKYKHTHKNYLSLLTEKNELTVKNKMYEAVQKEYDLTASFISNPSIIQVKLKSSGNGNPNNATVFWNESNKEVYVLIKDLPDPPANKQLQLWAIANGNPVDAGVVDIGCKGICKMKNISNAQAFAITIEPLGGNPTPTLSQLIVMGNI